MNQQLSAFESKDRQDSEILEFIHEYRLRRWNATCSVTACYIRYIFLKSKTLSPGNEIDECHDDRDDQKNVDETTHRRAGDDP